MSWEKKVHDCTLPLKSDAEKMAVGSIWKCKKCGEKWRLVKKPRFDSMCMQRISWKAKWQRLVMKFF